MAFIKVNETFRYAIGGNVVVEFTPGVHDVSEAIAICAVRDLGVAEKAKDGKGLMPPIYADILGNPLHGESLRHLDPVFVKQGVGITTGVETKNEKKSEIKNENNEQPA